MIRLTQGVLAIVFYLSVVVPAGATLLGRLPATPGGTDYQAAYDDVLDVTWVTAADLSGADTWDNQVAWANGLNYLGFDDWRLASSSVAAGLPTGTTGSVVDCSTATEPACRDNELGYMFYQNLGGAFGNDLRGDQTVGDVTLKNIQSVYWSGTEFVILDAWLFSFGDGLQSIGRKHSDLYGWAVRAGDVAAVPEPGALALMALGLLGLGVGRRKRRATYVIG